MAVEIFLLTIAIYGILIFSYRTCDKNATMLFSEGLLLNVAYLLDFLLTGDSIMLYFVSLTAVVMIIVYHLVKVRE